MTLVWIQILPISTYNQDRLSGGIESSLMGFVSESLSCECSHQNARHLHICIYNARLVILHHSRQNLAVFVVVVFL